MSVSSMLDLSLEEIIKSRKKQGGGGGGGRSRGGRSGSGGGRGGSRGSGSGGGRPRGGRAVTNTTSARIRKNTNAMEIDSQPKPKGSADGQWKHDLFDGGAQGRGEKSARVVIQTGAKLTISNLAYDVLGNDLKDIFKQYGEVKSAQVFFDKTDRSTGEAEVVFANRADAQKAARELDGALVNNQAISVKFVGTNVVKKVGGGAASSNGSDGSLRISATNDGSQRIVVAVGGGASTSSGGGRRSRGSGGGGSRVASMVSTPAGITKGTSSGSSGRRGRGRRGGRGRERSAPPTKEDLDAEMEDYHQNAE